MPIRTYLYNRFNDKKFRLNGIKPSTRMPSKENLRQFFSDHVLYSTDQLPPKVDLRPDMTPVEDQSRIGSCSANSLAGAYEYLLKKVNGSNIDMSRLFIYYNGRTKKSTAVTDKGCSMTDAIEALEEFGTCFESVWPYDITSVNVRPNDQAYEQAKDHQITEALKININLDEMKSCLAQGFPFAFGLRLYKSFDKASKTGVVPIPNEDEQSRTEHGRHALLAVGYSDQSRAFIVRNSWGEDWGDKGYCYIPYDYMTNSNFCFDAWTIRQVENDDICHEHWDNDDSIDYQSKTGENDDDNDDDHEIQDIEEDDGDDDDDD
ncbi:unnamed protein product [Rotaria sordida]|uniref:Peptidase C1A papain C-terminal domain-containing protein n=2 Tax=Rotaria sordida TaxID=392033 RepID=A0A814SJZ4_9BILA|nr:unnamed protein product [Rotaria sordida]CAF1382615.1 unnamed protein product [Rotaria sordida]